ncbi:FecR domain-containing protein [Vulgatibacter sp.]|uniref:FecR domain-containing protein n=1 Tax=Vulgatibacter sp. TaxID=1971226 RepID=UPI00356349AF
MSHEHEEQESGTLALRSLAGMEPSAAVQRRIVEGALARRRPSFPWAKVFTGLALAGAATAALVLTAGLETQAPVVPSAPLASVEAPAAGAVRQAGRYAVGPHRIEVATGGTLHFDSVAAGAAAFRVEAGSASFEVEKLQEGESFRVRTGQVLVEVVGTRFEVAAEGECSSVAVSEGRVRVTESAGIRYLAAGETGRYCGAATVDRQSGGEALVREAVVLVSRGEDLQRAAALLERYRADFGGGPFEEEALFYLTLAKARLGERAAADDLAAQFRQRFPGSARVERLEQWLGRTGR